MIDCYSVHLIKLIVMTFHLFTYVASVFTDESNEKTVNEGKKHLPITVYFIRSVSSSPTHDLLP